MVRFSNGQAIAIVPTIQKPDHSKSGCYCPDFRSNSKSRPFATQPSFDHSKSRLGQISDPHCRMYTACGAKSFEVY